MSFFLFHFSISFSRGSSQPRDQTRVSCIGGRRFNLWVTREAHFSFTYSQRTHHLWHLWSPNVWGFFPIKKFSMISARYPTIQFNSDTVYLELVPDSIDLRPQSHKVPWSQVPHTHILVSQSQVPVCYLYFWLTSYKQGSHDPLLGFQSLLEELIQLRIYCLLQKDMMMDTDEHAEETTGQGVWAGARGLPFPAPPCA